MQWLQPRDEGSGRILVHLPRLCVLRGIQATGRSDDDGYGGKVTGNDSRKHYPWCGADSADVGGISAAPYFGLERKITNDYRLRSFLPWPETW